ncbi:serine/threonine-protein kinase RIO1 [Zootermopsis nevadensis]|uniref:Serine/threonine-protein kinase RIO1 n=1 Tax=Zootermopsis nevadensis TaxID=136037 RepID=A0A067RA80_ZOONE|nr:serine/threonine-protein kinase RIO1 [Zootermopsis nevadensis]XP_021917457.1 serine/threonine-protein kinase RIO1 [Zootermopsis nevadensis]KDR20687.1 Serine/threonine-protein kinase RIO1 [Zootermopsis nevadensis]
MEDVEEGQFDEADDLTVMPTTRGKPVLRANLLNDIADLSIEQEDDEFSSDCGDDFEDNFSAWAMKSGGAKEYGVSVNNSYQPQEKQLKRFINKINVEKYEGPTLPNHAANMLIESSRKFEAKRIQTKDKHDRATAEQVMDPRTRMILFKLLNRGTITAINGCISTGKEANVYHATGKADEDVAIKIYKTSILVFKDRDKYVSGEFRFRHGYCRHNPRKMVRTWAEKEMRNLVRMHSEGLPVPTPILLRGHVLLMGFIGKDGWPAPKLKDVDLSESRARLLYRDCVTIMWRLYNSCRLVHADLSEFNMLYHSGQLFAIDFAQAVEHDHPHALEFLRKDCTNISEFFRKKDVATMTVKELFDFITDPTITDSNRDAYLDKMSERAAARMLEEVTAQEQIDEEVFKKSFIPRRLTEVVDAERDIERAQSGGDLVYQTVTGLQPQDTVQDDGESSSSSSDNSESCSNFVNSSRPRDESLESKKLRKKTVKEQKAEKRKTKIKKHVKKRKEKLQQKKK